jgi:hypothetical protein
VRNLDVIRGSLVADFEWLPYALVVAGAVAAALIFLYATRMTKTKQKPFSKEAPTSPSDAWAKRLSLIAGRTVSSEEAQEAKDRLKLLNLEREILSFGIRRLYEAQAEGKITEEERERIAQRYKSRMMKVRDSVTKSESVVALHELESMQEDLVKLFSERFDELGKKVEELRVGLQIKAEKEEEVETPTIPLSVPQAESAEPEKEKEREKKKLRKKPQPSAAPRTDAEKRIEEIRAEVEKVLERLGQMEVEGEA